MKTSVGNPGDCAGAASGWGKDYLIRDGRPTPLE